ncbi:MAG: LPS assembly protein LptD [Pseudomonadota bacterium]
MKNPLHGRSRLLIVIFILTAFPLLASAAEPSNNDPWLLKADSLVCEKEKEEYTAYGNVSITRGDIRLTADKACVNRKADTFDANGNVILTSGQDIIFGDKIVFNMGAETGTIYNGKIFLADRHFYIKGDKIIKTGKDSYLADYCSITTCDGDSPAWRLTGKDLDVTIEGYGTIRHAALWTKSIPVLYAPYMVFPLKLKRQSGLLTPQLSHSRRDGFEYNLPFYWAINKSSDATFYQHGMTGHRGIKHGIEYRYALDNSSKGTMMYDFLYDRQIDTGIDPVSGYIYKGYREDNEQRLNKKRWWFRTKSNQDIGKGFSSKLDLDLVSDQDYLREFRDGYSGFDSTKNYYFDSFGRDIDDYTKTVRDNRITLDKNWGIYNLNAGAYWRDDVILRNKELSDDDVTAQYLPYLGFTSARQQIEDSPFFSDFTSSYKHSWERAGTKGHVVDLHPRIYSPMRFSKYLNFEPSIGVQETLWQVDARSNKDNEKKEVWSRELYDIKNTFSTELIKVFSLENDTVDKIKHSIVPEVVHTYVPDKEQEDIPTFVENLPEQNILTYSITNNFIARMAKGKTYLDFCRFKVTQSYDIKETRRGVDENLKQGDKTPFSDVTAELEINPFQRVGLDGDIVWSPYDGEYRKYSAAVFVNNKRGDSISTEYRYNQKGFPNISDLQQKSIVTSALLRLSESLAARAEEERNLEDGVNIRTGIGGNYTAQCWSADIMYITEKEGDQRYLFTVTLHGLGEFSTSKK